MNIPHSVGSSKVMIYFHANAEDIGLASELLEYMRALLRVHVIAVEYPGYGIYTESHQMGRSHYDLEETKVMPFDMSDVESLIQS